MLSCDDIMNIAEEALAELYPSVKETREIRLAYHGKFKGYGGNIRWSTRHAQGAGFIEVRIAKEWKDVSPLIQKGLIQHLFLKLYKIPARTESMEMYDRFLKNLSKVAFVNKQDPFLLERFNAVNQAYFAGALDPTNLVWGNSSFSKLGTYTYSSDTITMSAVFKGIAEEDLPLLDYVLYHEMLHKEQQFHTKNGRMHSHTRAFREREREFKLADAEGALQSFLRRSRRAYRFAERPLQDAGTGKRGKKTLLQWLFD
jgi:hypothetical protein